MALSTGFNEFKEALRNFIIDSLDVGCLIEDRVFAQDLATLFEPVFPMATFSASPGSDRIFIQQFDVIIRVYSSSTYFEAHEVFNAIRGRLGCVTIQPRIIIRVIQNPIEDFDEISRLYTVSGRFKATRLLSRNEIEPKIDECS